MQIGGIYGGISQFSGFVNPLITTSYINSLTPGREPTLFFSWLFPVLPT